MSLYILIKNILWTGILLVIAPFLVTILKDQYGCFFYPQNRVGIITINNSITESPFLIQKLNILFTDSTIKGVVLHVDCSGGLLGSAQLIHQEIEYLKKEYPKPIITLVENFCTAEGYLIACATDAIIAPAGALIGDIYPSYESHKQRFNIINNEEYTQTMVDDAYAHIMTTIAHKRKLSLKEHEVWGKQNIFTGSQALKVHLIDQVGSMLDVQRLIKEKALIDGDIQWVRSPFQEKFLCMLKKMVGF